MSPVRRHGDTRTTPAGGGAVRHEDASQTRTARSAQTSVTRVPAPLVLDRYALRKRLGTGAFGTVWMARDERLERDVAVKILARELISDGRFEREARAAARLSHPAIVTLYEAAVDDEGAYLVSELVRGETLGALLDEGRLSDRDIVEIGIGLCDGLAHAHDQGVVHRDVKPSNVLVPRSGRSTKTPCKLTDFGIARVIDSDSLTLTGDVVGTLDYMAPEQAAGLEAGEPADLYSLALVLYEALSGVNPLRGSIRPGSDPRRRPAVRLPPLRRQRRDLPAPMADAIDRALRPGIDERGSLAELRNGLTDAVEHLGVEAGVVTGAFDRPARDGDEPASAVTRLFAPREPARVGADESELPDADPSRLIWQGRALAAAGCAATVAWLDHTLLQAHGALSFPVALVALVAGALTLALPRIGWMAAVGYVCAAAAIQGAVGAAALVAIAAALPVLLLPASPTLWSLSAVAPALGLIGLAGAWPALAGWARRPWRRMMLGATGWLWLGLAAPLASARGRVLYEPRPPGELARPQWEGSITAAASHVLSPLAHSGQLAGAAVWAATAILVPWVVRRRRPLLDALRAVVWAAALVAATPIAIAASTGATRVPDASSAIMGGVAAAAFALGPVVVGELRYAGRRASFAGGIP
jgi:tRNA A-37 threonylcarbamoyl transferase component Bud32